MKSERNKRPTSAISRIPSAVSMSSKSNRPKSAAAEKALSRNKPDMKLIFKKNECAALDVNQGGREEVPRVRHKSSSMKKPKPRDFGSLNFYIDEEHFKDDGKPKLPAEDGLPRSAGNSPESNTFDRVSRPTIRHNFSRKNGSFSNLVAKYHTPTMSLSNSHTESYPSLTLNDTHVYDPAFITAMRNVSYSYPARTYDGLESSETEESEEKIGDTHEALNHDWRVVKSSTIYPYHRRCDYNIYCLLHIPYLI
jgi:hypothetical protein